MNTHSRKAKGKRLQKKIAKDIQTLLNLNEMDVQSRPMGEKGTDIMFSPLAQLNFPYDIECKKQETINIWDCITQTEHNVQHGNQPLLIIKKNHTEPYAVIRWDHFLKLVKQP